MDNKETSKREMFVNFIRRFGYLILLGVIIFTLTLVLLLTGTNKQNIDKNGDQNVNSNVAVQFHMPLMNATVIKSFCGDNLMYNTTLEHWEAHKSIDFMANEGQDVFACLDGKVIDVSTSYLKGTTITLLHDNNLKTVYSSLQEDVNVKEGDEVKRGDVIGKAGATANSELKLGAHLNFMVLDNDKKIDPSGYLNLSEK